MSSVVPETLFGVEDPLIFQPWTQFGSAAAGRRSAAVFLDEDTAIIWQGSVYEHARHLVESIQPSQIVDIGCGSGTKLLEFFGDLGIPLLQADLTDVRTPDVRDRIPFEMVNLESPVDLDRLAARIADEPTLVIVSDVIEHLRDPRWLLRMLRIVLKRSTSNRLILSTPDRERIDGIGTQGPPDNPAHVRQWTLRELGMAMLSSGFEVEVLGRAPQNQFDADARTIVAQLWCTEESHRDFFARNGWPAPANHVVVTCEHAETGAGGGIGSYCAELSKLEVAPIFLFTGQVGLTPERRASEARQHGWLHTDSFRAAADSPGDGPDAVGAWAAIEHLVFLYDQIRVVEYQDYLGIGLHIAQGKRAFLLPPEVTTACYAHGNNFYLDNAAGVLRLERDEVVDAEERQSIELADVAVFPSSFLRDLYVDSLGLALREAVLQPYPLALSPLSRTERDYQAADTLLFYGRESQQKGYPDFLEAVRNILEGPLRRRVRRVLLMGVAEPPPWLTEMQDIKTIARIYSRDEARQVVRDEAVRAIVALPYRGDNQPLAVSEVVGAGARFVAYATGGIPEQFPESVHRHALCSAHPDALTERLSHLLTESHYDRWASINAIHDAMGGLLREARLSYENTFRGLVDRVDQLITPDSGGSVSAVITTYEGERRLLQDAATGLRHSLIQPAEVLIVDDGSSLPALEALRESAAEDFHGLNARVLALSENVGLAGARNAGLASIATDYVVAHDNDNVVLPDFLAAACRILDRDPSVGAVTCWSVLFQDGEDWNLEDADANRLIYRPSGADLGVGFRHNVFGDALSVYRTSALREIGGWDASSRAKWEDWQLFLRLTLEGWNTVVIPRVMYAYRVREDSMTRTYADLPGWERLWRTLPVPRNLQFGLLRSIVRSPSNRVFQGPFEELRGELWATQAHARRLQEELDAMRASRSWRATRGIRASTIAARKLRDGFRH